MPQEFTWRDGERTIRFGRGVAAQAAELLGEGYVLLTTARAQAALPGLASAAAEVVLVPAGRVDEIAGDLLSRARPGTRFAALGGGRVIDVAKALAAAAADGASAAAVPTTLSAAEMTWVHRHARGVDPQTPRVRPSLVINDPQLSASQPAAELAASAANALAHAVEGAATTLASPVPVLAAREAARLLAGGLREPGDTDRDALALGALLSGYAIDSAWYGLHHVMAQALVREGGAGHGEANAALLPVTSAALRRRNPAALAALDEAIGAPVEDVARRFGALASVPRLRATGLDGAALERCARAASERAELALTPPAADADELLDLYRQAW